LFPLSITDSLGREIVLEKPPERIIPYDAASVEILFAIGEGHRVVGTHSFVTYPPEVANVAKVGDAFNINVEKVVELQPDLVFLFFERFVQPLEAAGVKVLYLKTLNQTLDDVSQHIRLWGRITENTASAEALAKDFEGRIQAIRQKVAAVAQGPRVFYDVGDLWTPGPDTLHGRLLALLKAQNIAHDITGFQQLSPEVVVDRDPEVIITSANSVERFTKGQAFQVIAAVKSNRVVSPPTSGFLAIAGPRLPDEIDALGKMLYPEVWQ
jgi:iron complex transport system substrate-binding protein